LAQFQEEFSGSQQEEVPTGDPNCPPEVIEAKHITGLIKARSNCQNFDDSEAEDDDNGSNDGIADNSKPAETPINKKKRSWGSKRKGAPAQLVRSSGRSRRSAAGACSESAMESYIRLQQLQMEARAEERLIDTEDRRRREESADYEGHGMTCYRSHRALPSLGHSQTCTPFPMENGRG
jgi:hypothetical protein